MLEQEFLVRTPARHEILARNGLSSLARNITARPCKTLLPPNLTGPKGGLRPSKRGLSQPFGFPPLLTGTTPFFFYVLTVRTYVHIRSRISCETRVARWDPGLTRKVTYSSCKVSQQDQTLVLSESNIRLSWDIAKTDSTERWAAISVMHSIAGTNKVSAQMLRHLTNPQTMRISVIYFCVVVFFILCMHKSWYVCCWCYSFLQAS